MKKKRILVIIFASIVVIEIALLLIYLLSSKDIIGTFSFNEVAIDNKYNVKSETGILIKKVEMVQYHKNGDGEVELVFANYPLESLDGYDNPEFPEDIVSEEYYSDSIKFGEYELSENAIHQIIENKAIEKVQLLNLPEDGAIKDNLVIVNGTYVTASNEWALGEIKITYYYIDMSQKFKINASIKNNIITNIRSINIIE